MATSWLTYARPNASVDYLMVAFNRFRKWMVNNKTYIRFINTWVISNYKSYHLKKAPKGWYSQQKSVILNTHSKCHCCTYYVDFIFAPLFLNICPFRRIHTTVVKCSLVSILLYNVHDVKDIYIRSKIIDLKIIFRRH